MDYHGSALAAAIDHTLLRADASESDIRALCAEAQTYRFAAVCINPVWVPFAADLLVNTGIAIASVAAFPLGAHKTEMKVSECAEAVDDGATEIDLVANIGWLASDRFVEAEAEIRKVRRNLPDDITLKVIIECSFLSQRQWAEAAKAVANAGAAYVKTGTGFAGPAALHHVEVLQQSVGNRIRIKAAGGIRTCEQAKAFLAAGASRLGSSAGVAIMREAGIR